MTEIPIYQVDAFTENVFAGNPAAVCPLDDWLPAETMQNIAAENNLSETAFFVRNGDHFDIRWFTPVAEIDLAGHPTLATAHVIFTEMEPCRRDIRFRSKLGDSLVVQRAKDRLLMDFPSRAPEQVNGLGDVARALGAAPAELLRARDGFAVFETEARVRDLRPDMARVAGLDFRGLIVTAPGDDCDFVSRFFAPRMGIPEDPVTGSAHCTLIPYWAKRLDKTDLHARQISSRGGELFCRYRGERVEIGGYAALYMKGTIYV
jgi:PhzF family phenazine biosynthesis protein